MATRSCREKAQKLNEQHQLILSKLLREEDNKYCADCEAKGSSDVAAPSRGLLRPVTFPSPRRPGPERTPRLRPAGPGPEGRAGAGWSRPSPPPEAVARSGPWTPALAPAPSPPRPRGRVVPASRCSDPPQRAGARAGPGARNGATAWPGLRVKGLPSTRLSSQVHPWVGPPLVAVSASTLPP